MKSSICPPINVIANKIDLIIESIFSEFECKDAGLHTGGAGIITLLEFYSKYKQIDCSSQIEKIIYAINNIATRKPFFCDGQSGINWGYTYLYKNGILRKEDWSSLLYDLNLLKGIALAILEDDNYEFLYGAVGIGHCIAYDCSNEDIPFYVQLLNILTKKLNNYGPDGMFSSFNLRRQEIDMTEVDLGLAHGIPAILKLCVDCYNNNIGKADAKYIADRIIGYLLDNTNSDKSISFFPTAIERFGNNSRESRLAWCNGDLTIAFILYQAGSVFENDYLTSFALEVLVHNSRRYAIEDTRVVDVCFCHGTAGIAHIFNKMWRNTNNDIFKVACDFWIARTLDFAVHEDGVGGFKTYNYLKREYEKDYTLLTGATGVGLVLLSYLTGNFEWDYCLMLNDIQRD